jgi:uncharacterized protein (TIGR02453 family)
MAEFTGFPPDLFRFLRELGRNNNRPWFHAERERYLAVVVRPMSEFIIAMQPRLAAISRHYDADPRPHGGSMFRIHRDTRFARDKTPYKTHAACQFRHVRGRDAHAPGFYVHLEPDGLWFGGGIWRPPAPQLNRIRDFIVDNARSWARIRNAPRVRTAGGIQGDALTRAPRGYNPEHMHIEDIKRTSFYVMTDAEPDAALEPDFPDTVAGAFRRAAPLTRFVCDALDLPF